MEERKCKKCQVVKGDGHWHKSGGHAYSTYCKDCNKIYAVKKADKRKALIMKATNNGKCWWVYQSIVSDTHFRTPIKKKKR